MLTCACPTLLFVIKGHLPPASGCRMESTSSPSKIQLSKAAHDLIQQHELAKTMKWKPSGGLPIKGVGVMDTYIYEESSGFKSFADAVLPKSTEFL